MGNDKIIYPYLSPLKMDLGESHYGHIDIGKYDADDQEGK